MKIAFFGMAHWEKDYFKKEFPNARFFDNKLTKNNVSSIKDVEVLVIFIFSKLNKIILSKLPNLKYIATMSTGFDHIDIEYCKERNIKVANVPFYGENTVAEHAFALLLSISRKIHKACCRMEEGVFSLDGIRGFDLKGKTVGVVGGGNIGMHLLRMAKGFGMKVLVYDVYKNRSLQQWLGFKYVSLNKLLKESDVISLHVPYNVHTHHLIDKNKLKLLKKGAVLINTSRGAIIDMRALYVVAKTGKIEIGLDVYEDENLLLGKELMTFKTPKNDRELVAIERKLINLPNVLATPHDAFNSIEALRRIEHITIQNIKCFLRNKVINKVS